MVQIIETSVFTRLIGDLMDDDTYRMLQTELAGNPERGDLIPQSGGLRKIRWGLRGRGKRGGVRIIYYWAASSGRIIMLYAFPKNVRDDLPKEQLKILRRAVESEFI